MHIKYYTAACGAGKSYQAARRIIATPGRYIIVRDRVEAIAEYSRQLHDMANTAGVSIPIASITAEAGQSVRLQVEDVPARYGDLPHVVVMITHKALMMCDFSGFTGWSIIIDETPVILDRQDLQTSQSRAFFEANYQLDHLTKGWSSVTLTDAGWTISPADLERDDLFRALKIFHQRVTSASILPDKANRDMARRAHDDTASQRAVIGNLSSWSDMDDGRKWSWCSVWSPMQLRAFDSVEVMANGFDKSITFDLLKRFNTGVTWEEVRLTSLRTFAPRTVRIRYYAEGHVASLSRFGSDDGAACLRAIAIHLSDRRQIWMSNDRSADALAEMGGQQLRPHQAGSNSYAGYHEATCIYAAKPSAETRSVLTLLGVEGDAWTRSYEHEAILQFCCRTSVRDPLSSETVTLTVYDRDQADYLAAYFGDQPHITVEMELVDLGFAHDAGAAPGPKAKTLTPEEAEAKRVERTRRKSDAQRRRRLKAKGEVAHV